MEGGWRTQIEGLITALPDPAVAYDRELHPIVYNAAYARLTGLRHRELAARVREGCSIDELVTRTEGADPDAPACIESGRSSRVAEVEVRNAGGDVLIAWVTHIPLRDASNEIVAGLQIVRDVSAEARLQDRFKTLLSLTRARAEELQLMVDQRTKELRVAFEEVKRLSRTDDLTGLLNRRAFSEVAERAFELASRHDRCLAVVMCDVDHFKRFNDAHGHKAGDHVLVAVAQALSQAVRKSDVVARFGGEEFVLLFTETRPESVIQAVDRCRLSVEAVDSVAMLPEGAASLVTASFGVAVYPRDGSSLSELLVRADQALYEAKRAGRNRVVGYGDLGAAPRSGRVTATRERRSVLVVDGAGERRDKTSAVLSDYAIQCAATLDEAVACLRRERFDVVVADEDVPPLGGAALMIQSLPVSPESVRVLCVAHDDFYVAQRAANGAAIDCFLLRSDVASRLPAAIEDGLAYREILREHILRGEPFGARAQPDDVTRLHQIIDQAELHVVYQPIRSCVSAELFAFEALCRAHATSLLPNQLFDLAVREGRIWDLGRIIRKEVGRQLDGFASPAFIFLNLHAAELGDPSLLAADAGLGPHATRLVFEVTERASVADVARLREILFRLRSRGYRFAVDDLGAGYASLNSVAILHPDFLKIDMSIVRDIDRSRTKRRLVRRIVEFANDEGIEVIGEGVQRREEADALAEVGCHHMQGYWCGIPRPLAELGPTDRGPSTG